MDLLLVDKNTYDRQLYAENIETTPILMDKIYEVTTNLGHKAPFLKCKRNNNDIVIECGSKEYYFIATDYQGYFIT